MVAVVGWEVTAVAGWEAAGSAAVADLEVEVKVVGKEVVEKEEVV